MKNKRLLIIIIISLTILLIPIIAMQFTEEVNWSLSDFIIGGILLLGTGLILEFTLRKTKDIKYRVIIIIVLILIFLLIWADLAVGLLNFPWSGD